MFLCTNQVDLITIIWDHNQHTIEGSSFITTTSGFQDNSYQTSIHSMLFLFLFRSVYYKYTALYVLTALVGFVNFTRPRRLGDLTSVEGNTVLCYCTQDTKWRPGGGRIEERVIVSLKVNFKGNTVVPWIILPLESSWVWWTFTTNIVTIDHSLYYLNKKLCLSSFRKIKTKNKNPTYLSIFFRSIIWEPENFFCMA